MEDEQREPSRDVFSTRARWSREVKGYVAVTNLATGETVEIPYGEATPVWREDIRRLPRRARPADRTS